MVGEGKTLVTSYPSQVTGHMRNRGFLSAVVAGWFAYVLLSPYAWGRPDSPALSIEPRDVVLGVVENRLEKPVVLHGQPQVPE